MIVILGLLSLAFCAIITLSVYRRYRASTDNFLGMLAICIFAVGILGFVEPFWINMFPRERLDRFELPNTLYADRLTAPDGHVFIVNFLRVQRYGPEGFEKGFMVGRRASRSAMSASGNVLICSFGGELFTYTPDGAELPARGSCRDGFEGSSSFYPSNAKVPAIAFNWFSAVAVPLWHPGVGWVISLCGVLLLKGNARA